MYILINRQCSWLWPLSSTIYRQTQRYYKQKLITIMKNIYLYLYINQDQYKSIMFQGQIPFRQCVSVVAVFQHYVYIFIYMGLKKKKKIMIQGQMPCRQCSLGYRRKKCSVKSCMRVYTRLPYMGMYMGRLGRCGQGEEWPTGFYQYASV